MGKAERIERLRSVEQPVFRICCELLQCEKRAHDAAKRTLVRLYRNEAFFEDGPEAAFAIVRREAMRVCLALHAEGASAREQGAIA